MQITPDPELEQKIQHKVESGEYASMNAALRRFLEPYKDPEDPLPLEDMRREIRIAAEQVEHGEVVPFDVDSIIAKGRQLLAERQARNKG